MSSTTLGTYRLGARLGRGGMGEVWQAVHGPTQRPVAVKLLHRAEPAFVEAVRTEARAIARLDHPHVVALLDIGVVARDTPTRLRPGTPYLVMELVEGGDLAALAPTLGWPDVRRLADEVLDALGHAHARGVIHRDVKPANVLRARPTDTRPGWRLTDFGLAHGRFDPDAAVREGARGSPRTMAPEQFVGYRRDLGPWTDLYGLGCVIWSVLTGSPVFDAEDVAGLQRAHLQDAPPAFQPRTDVPEGLEDWLRVLLSKRPVDRFACAADAREALLRLDRGPRIGARVDDPSVDDDDGGPGGGLTFDLTDSTELLSERAPASIPPGRRPRRPRAASHPPSWRDDAESAPRAPLASASPAIALLREPPFVGREVERDRLWQALSAVHDSGRPRLVQLNGPPGLGESRLARWLVHRARETGSAHGLFVHHGPMGEGGMAELVADVLHLHGLSETATRERLLHLASTGELDEDADLDVLTRIVHPGDEALAWELHEGAVLALLRTLCLTRPVVLVLDDLHRSAESRELTRAIVERGLPILVLATGQPPAEADDREGALEAAALVRELGAESIDLGPLDAAARRLLVRRTVDLDDALAQRLEARSQGHPQLLVEILVGWVRQGRLEPGPHGFRLADTGPILLPDSLEEVVAAQLDAALQGRDPSETWAVEVAAILGSAVDVRAWARTCLLAGAHPAPDLVQHLIESGIWRHETEQGGGLRFTSSLLRAVVLQRALAAGRLVRHHRAAATRIDQDGGRIDRLGLHRLRAGDAEGAVEPLLRAAEDEVLARDVGEAARISGWLREALDALPRAVLPQARARAHLLQATLHILRGATDDADEDLACADELARAHRWVDLQARVALIRARRAIRQRRFDEALAQLASASKLADEARDRTLSGRARFRRGSLLLYLGRVDAAEVELQQARPMARSHPAHLAQLLMALARAATVRGEHDDARRLLREAEPWFRAAGSAWGPIAVRDHLAQLDRLDGLLDQAADGYRVVYENYLRLGLRQADIALLHHGLVRLAQGRHADARAELAHCVSAFRTWKAPLQGSLAWAARLACDAEVADAGGFDEALEVLRTDLRGAAWVHAELRPTLRDAAERARKRLDDARADAVNALLADLEHAAGVQADGLAEPGMEAMGGAK